MLLSISSKPIYKGKVRDCYDIGYNLLAMLHSDRQSAFDRHICDIPGKGIILTYASKWWFERTQYIIPNHFIYSRGNTMIVKKCQPFKVEVVVRAYITGSTKTSLWTHYNNDERVYCGITFPDGLVKNQKLDRNYVTPTTKSDSDEPISEKDIVELGLMTEKEWIYVKEKALELFEFGQMIADKRGLILVDTKYEFGKDVNGDILLIDEVHTCDSSRYWLKSSYEERFTNKLDPQSFDKDIVRQYLNRCCDPYHVSSLPEIPDHLIEQTRNAYTDYINLVTQGGFDRIPVEEKQMEFPKIIGEYFEKWHKEMVVIFSGSDMDFKWVNEIDGELNKRNIYYENHVASAHKNIRKVLELLDYYNQYHGKRKIVLIAVAGRSNALGGVLAANSKYPVINCPPFKDKLDMMININSSIQNPSNVPSMLVLEPNNVGGAVEKILRL